MPFASVLGLSLCALVSCAIAMQLLNVARLSPPVRLAVFACLMLLVLTPVEGLIIAGYVRGLIGDPSLATVLMMAMAIIRQMTGHRTFDERNIAALLLSLLGTGFLFYPLALGLGSYDPYALGYGSWGFYFALLAVALTTWWLSLHLVVIWIVGAVAAYTLKLLESTNLWDYLIDPLAFVIALGWGALKLVMLSRGRPHLERTLA
jgi:hypothetical protein